MKVSSHIDHAIYIMNLFFFYKNSTFQCLTLEDNYRPCHINASLNSENCQITVQKLDGSTVDHRSPQGDVRINNNNYCYCIYLRAAEGFCVTQSSTSGITLRMTSSRQLLNILKRVISCCVLVQQ